MPNEFFKGKDDRTKEEDEFFGGKDERIKEEKAIDAQHSLIDLENDLKQIEKERIINLNNEFKNKSGIGGGGLSVGDILEVSIKRLRPLLNYLDPKKKHFAEGLILRAETYIAAHDSAQATESPASAGHFISPKERIANMKSFLEEEDKRKKQGK
jgi:hypothetical protein